MVYMRSIPAMKQIFGFQHCYPTYPALDFNWHYRHGPTVNCSKPPSVGWHAENRIQRNQERIIMIIILWKFSWNKKKEILLLTFFSFQSCTIFSVVLIWKLSSFCKRFLLHVKDAQWMVILQVKDRYKAPS